MVVSCIVVAMCRGEEGHKFRELREQKKETLKLGGRACSSWTCLLLVQTLHYFIPNAPAPSRLALVIWPLRSLKLLTQMRRPDPSSAIGRLRHFE